MIARILPDRVFLTVMDSVGVGELPDADKYGDRGSDTIGNISRVVPLKLPALRSLGLPRVASVDGMAPVDTPIGAFGRMAERSAGKAARSTTWRRADAKYCRNRWVRTIRRVSRVRALA